MATKDRQALDDRGLIRWQLMLGSGLIAFGALSILLFQVSGVLDGQTATAAVAVATGVIGAGAAMLPTGAAAGASARILQLDQNLIPTGSEARKGQVGTPSQDGQ